MGIKFKILLFFLMVNLVGCSSTHQSLFEKKKPILYGNQEAHTINQTKNGVYIYKDNSTYNTTNYKGSFTLQHNSNIEFEPGAITFGPKNTKYK